MRPFRRCTTRRCPHGQAQAETSSHRASDGECEWLVAYGVLPAELVTRNRRSAEATRRPWTPVFTHGDLQICHVFVDGDEVTGTVASSMRLYLECAPQGPGPFYAGKIDFPIAGSIFPREIFTAPRFWAELLWSDTVYWNEVDHGGHVAAMEQPVIFVSELREAFRSFRS